MNTHIIHADSSQAAMIASIGKKSFRNAFEHLFNSRMELFEYLARTYDPLKIARSLEKERNTYLLAYQEGEPAGFAKLKWNSLHEEIESIAQAELQKLFVLPAYQGKGVGQSLLEEVKSLVTSFQPDYLWLDTHVSNEKAIRLYEKNGFVILARQFFGIGTQKFENYVMALRVMEHANRPGGPGERSNRVQAACATCDY
jgi:ribosomal protein S18 acetylase RimI-like enzyme